MKLKLEYFAPLVMLLWLVGSLLLHFSPRKVCRLGRGLVWAGVLTLGLFICLLWLELGHPPLRTIGETRLWYSLLLSLTGVIGFVYWRILWLQSCSLAMAALFLGLNLAYPEMLERVLMPALQSPWFVPHVVVYLEAYALLTGATLVALRALVRPAGSPSQEPLLPEADRLAQLGYAFLTLGLLFGALWAKTAWGHYWSWDPKETWALLTWLCYLAYIHVRYRHPASVRLAYGLLLGSFAFLMLCWFGVNYLPAASMHSY